jgi:hypothetical protein
MHLQWARYGALGTGIVYGFVRNRKLHKVEEEHQAFLHRKAEAKAKKDKEYADLVAAAAGARGGACCASWLMASFVRSTVQSAL